MRPDSFVLEPVSPFRLDLTVWALRRRPDNVVDRWDGRTYRNRLAVHYGQTVHEGDVAAYAFPQAEDLATLHPAHLRELGFSLQKGRAMIELARAITEEGLDLEGLAELPDEEAIECLCGLRGVGRWSAEYVLLRGLGPTHVFPGDDVGARKNLQRWLNLLKPLEYAGVHRTVER